MYYSTPINMSPRRALENVGARIQRVEDGRGAVGVDLAAERDALQR
jgi:hypothetical protein